MISLANSILIQRIHKVNSAVNAKILYGLTSLVPISSESDCHSTFQVLRKITTDAAWHNDHIVLAAVCRNALLRNNVY